MLKTVVVTVTALLVSSADVSAAPDLKSDALLLSLDFSELSPGSGGGRAAVDWLRSARPGILWVAGISSSRLDDSEWTVGRFGVFAEASPRLGLRGDAHLGGGRRGGQGFDYRLFSAGMTWEILDQRLYLDLEDRYFDVDTSHGNLAQVGLRFLPGRRLSAGLAYYRATGGNTEADFVSGRLDVTAGRLRFLGGFALGRTRPEVVGMIGGDATDLEQVYVGVAFPVAGKPVAGTPVAGTSLAGSELTVVVDVAWASSPGRVTTTS